MRPRLLRAQQTNGQSIPSYTPTLLQWDSPSVNTAKLVESTDNVFTVTIPGLYLCQYLCVGTSSGAITQYVYKNGVEPASVRSIYNMGVNYGGGFGYEFWIDLQAGDTLSFGVDMNASTLSSDSTIVLTIYML